MRALPHVKPSFETKIPLNFKKSKKNIKNFQLLSHRNRQKHLSEKSKPITIPFNSFQDPIVTDVIGSSLVKGEKSCHNPYPPKYLYKRRTLYGMPSNLKSMRTLKKPPQKLRVTPAFWTREKKELKTHRKIDTKGIGLLIKPPASFLPAGNPSPKTSQSPNPQRSNFRKHKRQSAPHRDPSQKSPFTKRYRIKKY